MNGLRPSSSHWSQVWRRCPVHASSATNTGTVQLDGEIKPRANAGGFYSSISSPRLYTVFVEANDELHRLRAPRHILMILYVNDQDHVQHGFRHHVGIHRVKAVCPNVDLLRSFMATSTTRQSQRNPVLRAKQRRGFGPVSSAGGPLLRSPPTLSDLAVGWPGAVQSTHHLLLVRREHRRYQTLHRLKPTLTQQDQYPVVVVIRPVSGATFTALVVFPEADGKHVS